jgi:hypothetical protein
MRIRTPILLLSAAAALLALSPPSFAAIATTWTVRPGGPVVAKSGVIKLTDTATGKAGTCKSSRVSGTIKSGSGLSGKGIASVTAMTLSTCTGPGGVAFKVTASGFPWKVNLTSFNPKTGVVSGSVSGIRVTLVGGGCSAMVAGTAATSPGMLKATYGDGTHKLKFLATGGTLHFWDVQGCLGMLNDGDPAAFTGSYTAAPAQVITSP